MLPDVPVIVRVYWPRAAVLLPVNVNSVVALVGLGENEAVTPLGRPDTDRVTWPAKPYCGLT